MGASKRKKVTIKQIIEAMRKNGYKFTRGTFFRDAFSDYPISDERRKDMEVVRFGSACAMGQAAANLGVNATELEKRLGMVVAFANGPMMRVSSAIVDMNDNKDMLPAAIADILEENLKNIEDMAFILPVQEYIYEGGAVTSEEMGA